MELTQLPEVFVTSHDIQDQALLYGLCILLTNPAEVDVITMFKRENSQDKRRYVMWQS